MAENRLTEAIKNDKGQAMIEFCLILPLFVIVIMFLVITYDLIDEIITVQQDIRYELRKSVDENSRGDFRLIEKSGVAAVQVPGKMKALLGYPLISLKMTLSSYGGCYHNRGKDTYHRRNDRLYELYRL